MTAAVPPAELLDLLPLYKDDRIANRGLDTGLWTTGVVDRQL